MNKFFIIDAYSLIYRAYYAFINNPRKTAKGIDTSAIFGFVNYLFDVIENQKPTHIAVCFDPQKPSFRREIYEQYKANRQQIPEAIKEAIPYIKKILTAMNIKFIELENYEADDIAGSLAKKFASSDTQIFLYTSDKDYLQLIDQNINVFKPKNKTNQNEIIDLETFKKEFQLDNPRQFIDILALMGDASDNIPGVPKIGEKTAFRLIQQFKSLDNLLKNLHILKPSEKINLEQNRHLALLSKQLVTIITDINLIYKLEDFIFTDPNFGELTAIFEELEFKKALERIANIFNNQSNREILTTKLIEDINTTSKKYILVENKKELDDLIDKLNNSDEFAFDTETDNINPIEANIVGFSFSICPNEAYFVYCYQNEKLLELFTSIFSNSNKTLIGHNIKFDLLVLKNYNIDVKNKFFDTLIAHSLLEPDLKHTLDYLSENYLNYKTIHIDELIGDKKYTQKKMSDLSPDAIYKYACEDADIAYMLKNIFAEKIMKEQMNFCFYNIEMPLIQVLTDMEYTGIKINSDLLHNQSQELKKKLKEIEEKIYEIAECKFNIASSKQLGEILYEKLKITDKPKLTEKKQYSTDEKTLVEYQYKHPIIEKILEYRKISKLINTYIDALPKLISTKTKRIHTSFNQFVTITGRLSSNNPNLQNIPIKSDEGIQIRKAFVPEIGYVFIDADYSQIELRVMAHLSEDNNMLEAFNNNLDIHTQTAAKIYKVNPENVTKIMRSNAKSANFAMIYGSSAYGLSQNLKIPLKEAKTLLENYFSTYPKVKVFIEKQIQYAREHEFVTTLYGRKRKLPEINSKNATVRVNAEHNAINTPIQGTAADIIKIAMIEIHKEIKQKKLDAKILLQVHDELLIECKNEISEEVKNLVIEKMQNATKLSVPLVVDAKIGDNWADAH